ncbi:TA system VapC family ribonuclease toxin [Salinispira pacifica]
MILVDLNILLYAVNTASLEHSEARRWISQILDDDGETLGLTWIVILGFLRLATSPRLFPQPLDVKDALRFIDALLSHPRVRKVLPGENHWKLLQHLLLSSGRAGNLVNDAHLAACALEQGCVIATRDIDFARYSGIDTLRPF